jgi:hypothetical protein
LETSGRAALLQIARKLPHHVAIKLALEGHNEVGWLGDGGPAPVVELGLAAAARSDVDLPVMAGEARP